MIVSVGPDRQGEFEDIEVGIERLHLEQDAGKSMHDQHPTMSYVDLNRSGVALMEIVSKPDMRSADEAKAYVTKLRTIVRYLGTCDGNMDEGSMRADVNVSVRKPGGEFGTRCEIKNVNSIRFIGQAIDYEARRQIAILEDGGKIDQETRLFDPSRARRARCAPRKRRMTTAISPIRTCCRSNSTRPMSRSWPRNLPELPDDKKARFIARLGLSIYDASCWCRKSAIADYFEKVAAGRDGKLPPTGSSTICFGRLNKAGKDIENAPVSPRSARRGHRSDQGWRDLRQDRQGPVRDRLERGRRSARARRSRGMKQVTDTGAIEKAVDEIIAANPGQGRAGKRQADHGWLVRRPGDEGDRRQGQPAGCQRPRQGQAGHRVLASPDNTLFVAERAGEVVGTFQVTLIPGLVARGRKRAKIESVHVAPESRGHGIGAVMVEAALAFASDNGAELVELTSNKSRLDAHRFYRRLGFDQSHEGFKKLV
jgi:aspartyl-tRNA(Asn)/glutamyl-tRNA(Gln) amidotransferase subunit B